MKTSLIALTTLIIFAPVANSASNWDSETIKMLKSPTFSKEEMGQVLFSTSIRDTPGSISYAVYDPFRDKSIDGIVISIHSKDATSGQEQSVDLVIDVDCAPLHCANGVEQDFILAEAAKNSPVITLKEVHYPEFEKTVSSKGEANFHSESADAADLIFKKLLAAQAATDYEAFVADGTDELKGALSETQFKASSNIMNARFKGGYEPTFLGELNQKGYEVYLYRLRFKDGGDDMLATMSLKAGKVGGIYFH